jgi:uncharacterized protein
METFEKLFDDYMIGVCDENPDPSHDILHVRRVVKLAKDLAKKENANLNIVIPAAYLHDCVYICKSDSRRFQASTLSAEKAISLLESWGYDNQYFDQIFHAIQGHSFSANIKVDSLEAKIVQDADRLDALGAIGIARCFIFGGIAKRSIYHDEDPFCIQRTPDDSTNNLDHFFIKLLRLHEKLNTESAKEEGKRRLVTMESFLASLKAELLP